MSTTVITVTGNLAEDPEAMGLPAEQVFFALSDTDWLSAIGFRLSLTLRSESA